METNRIKYDDRRTMFFAVHEKHMSAIQQFIKDKNLVKDMDNPCFLYAIPPEQARQFTVECPPEVFVRKLEPSAAQQVSAAWPHNFPGSDSYLGKFIEANGGYGVFLKSNNEMVAWVLKHAFGHPAMLQTEEKHMKKGYGSLVTRVLSKEIAEEGHWPVCSVMLNNERSKRMFEKLGFRSIGTCVFISLKHSKN
jgi:ribosomal protein S18 acetylase RimI-like enzyme